MKRFVLLLKFTEKGISRVKDSPSRADHFRDLATKKGVTIEAQYWLLGEYDGLVVLSASSEEPITAVALHLASEGFVRTCLCRAYEESEFKGILGSI